MGNLNLSFSHPKMPDLNVPVKPNEISWSYGLNTANYPTYGGEVVQILSCFIEDMTVTGHIRNYRELEDVYSWFIDYIQLATQGGHFNPVPVTMIYPERGWRFLITPKSMPAFKYGRDITAPEWTMQAAIVDPEQTTGLQHAIIDQVTEQGLASAGSGIDPFGTVTGDIGFVQDNPFSSPDGDTAENRAKFNLPGSPQTAQQHQQKLADFYNNLIPSYLHGDFSDLSADYSRPTIGNQLGTPNPGTQAAKGVANQAKNSNH